ncbi:anti-sigma-factor antagonist [Denitrovibrio acetiphilus DSM 12809]|uniref:Anti-sigma factor antagonist n=1 Tax=Denitrovibrio acetiphilus (strain DSM 12809 / NBRC 114555 / N2460) TaxID=522772 RepID=D4H6D4_DENA2|nr:STAS domain-containing protein [Denitrovibrio acetiphilus]ADD69608.1 anti-sigma-factor antagonist [Denitrovibrio acetiphilus DSM 12809]
MFEVQDKGDKKLVFVKGEVNAQTGSELKKNILDIFNSANTVVLSFKGVVYMNSSGLREIIDLLKNANKTKKTLMLCEMTPDIREMFTFTGLDKVFKIYDTQAQALG